MTLKSSSDQEADDAEKQQDVLHRVAPDGEFRESERVVAFAGLFRARVRAGHLISLFRALRHCARNVSPLAARFSAAWTNVER